MVEDKKQSDVFRYTTFGLIVASPKEDDPLKRQFQRSLLSLLVIRLEKYEIEFLYLPVLSDEDQDGGGTGRQPGALPRLP